MTFDAEKTRQVLLDGVEKHRLRERLASYAHRSWSGWMKHLFGHCIEIPHRLEDEKGEYSVEIPSWAVKRWTRQMTTPYGALPEEEKESDRKEADKILELIARKPCGCTSGGRCGECEPPTGAPS
jgi:hypothetical protein